MEICAMSAAGGNCLHAYNYENNTPVDMLPREFAPDSRSITYTYAQWMLIEGGYVYTSSTLRNLFITGGPEIYIESSGFRLRSGLANPRLAAAAVQLKSSSAIHASGLY